MASKLDIPSLAEACSRLKYVVDGTGILMARGQFCGLLPDVQLAVDEVERITGLVAKHVMVNCMPPGTDSGWHVDPGPRFERWHLAIRTNEQALLFAPGALHLPLGHWHGPIKYWEEHRVVNRGKEPRVHLIVDLGER